ncbi:hypothetical protein FHG87_012832 [Trinorchestia longiramus]|nr:hypothetical protein FHG87_012832 [Trinorchestia longiramus]
MCSESHGSSTNEHRDEARELPDKLKVFQTIQKHLKLLLTGLREVGCGYNAFTEFESDVEKLLTQKATNTLTSIGLDTRLPLKIRAQRSVVCREIDSWIGGKSADELKQEIKHENLHLEVREIIKFGQYTHVFKIEFATINMGSHALQHGILCKHVIIAPSQIQQEKCIVILICFNCYKMEQHATKDCSTPNLTICSECTGNHTYKNCSSSIKKCLNCLDTSSDLQDSHAQDEYAEEMEEEVMEEPSGGQKEVQELAVKSKDSTKAPEVKLKPKGLPQRQPKPVE